jgi:hypothetical protein
MRVARVSWVCLFAAACWPAAVMAQSVAPVPNAVPSIVKQDSNEPPTSEEVDPPATPQASGATGQPIVAAPAAAPIADPFAGDDTPSRKKANSAFTTSLDLLYVGTYIPDLIYDHDKSSVDNDFFLDGAARWAVTQNASLEARVIVDQNDTKSGSNWSQSSTAVPLEYFYEQQFADQTQILTIGRRDVGWSSGFQWRPADVIDNGFTTKDINIQDPNRYLGVNQVRYEAIQSWFDFTTIVANRDKAFYQGDQLATRISFRSPVDFSLLYAANGDYSKKYGLTVDVLLPWDTTLDLEAVHINIDKGMLDRPMYFGSTLESLSKVSSYQDIYLSLRKFIDDKRQISVEYFHNGSGFKNGLDGLFRDASSGDDARDEASSSILSRQYVGRDYVYAAYTGYIDDWKLQFKPNLLINLDDGSYIGSFSLAREVGSNSELFLNINSYQGRYQTEFGSISHRAGFSMSYLLHLF